MNFLNLAKVLSAPNANLNLWPQKMGLEHDDYVHRTLHCVRSSHRKFSVRKDLSPATLLKKNTLAQVFSCCEFSSKNTFLQTTSGQLLILLCDFIFEPFSMIDFISPTNKDHYIKCICSKCFWEGITKSWIYYQFVARTVVNKYFNNEQKQTNDSVRKELVDFKKRQRKKE